MGESEGMPTRYLLGAFFAVVLLCAVFFSLGYFLGYREGKPPGAPLTQQVPASSDVPTPANPAAPPSAEPAPTGQSAPSTGEGGPASQATNPDQTAAASSGNPPPQSAGSSSSESPVATEAQSAPITPGDAPASSQAAADQHDLTPRSLPSGVLIQVGAVRSRQEASKVAETLRSGGYPALVLTPAQVGARDSFFRVVAGPYRSHARAQAALKKLAREGYRPFIRQ